jgi:sugar phosphate permease
VRYRWVVLATGTLAQASYSAILLGLSAILPALRTRYGLSLGQVGVLLAAPALGSMLSFLAWGIAADRLGERLVAPLGLGVAAAALFAAARTTGFDTLVLLLALAGLAGASVSAASGRAVMHWFEARERGLALGIRQAAMPIGGAAAAFGLPAVVAAGGTGRGLEVLGAGCLAGAALAGLLLRDAPAATADEPVAEAVAPLRDRRVWQLLAASSLLLFPQVALLGYTVLFLHDARGLSPAGAARVLAIVQVLGIAGRVGAGRWSDAVGSRLAPLRAIAAASGLLALGTGAAVGAPLVLLIPIIVAGGVAAMSWNGLSFTATAEIAGRARSGAALGLQQTALAIGGWVLPLAFAGLVAGVGWGGAWAVAAAGPAVAILILRGAGR